MNKRRRFKAKQRRRLRLLRLRLRLNLYFDMKKINKLSFAGQPAWDMNDYSRDFTWLGIDRSLLAEFKSKYLLGSAKGELDLPEKLK